MTAQTKAKDSGKQLPKKGKKAPNVKNDTHKSKSNITSIATSNDADTINAFITTATIISLKKIAEKYYWKDYKILSKVRLKKYKKDMDNTYPVDTAHMGTKARVLFPFLKAEFIAPIYLACCINKVMRNK